MRAERESAFHALLAARERRRVVDEDKDGNCLFRAFAHQVLGTPARHPEVRARCYDHMEAEAAYFGPFVSGGATPEAMAEYLALQRRDRAWGGEPEIQVCGGRVAGGGPG